MEITGPIMKFLLCLAIVAVVVLVAPAAGDLSCGQVSNSLAPCMNYLKGGVGVVPTACCNGVRSLNSAAKSTVDRQSACKCLKTFAGNIKGINDGLAAELPGQCGVSIPYKISPSTNCESVN